MSDDDAIHEGRRRRPENPKLSARAKYNRRRRSAAHALEQLRISAEDVLGQDGVIYKRAQLDAVVKAIQEFYAVTDVNADYNKWLQKLLVNLTEDSEQS
jgi:adenylate cyclase class IV